MSDLIDEAIKARPSKYALNRGNSRKAIQAGLAEADWYQCPIPRPVMRELLQRRNGPALRDSAIWFGLLITCAVATAVLWELWGSWYALIPYFIYATIYASTSDSRWHESSHGTAFKSDWLNNTLYQIASFMVMREPTVWKWSHTRHHSDTIIVGRDPEIAVPRPPDIKGMLLNIFALPVYPKYFKGLLEHTRGKLSEAEIEFIPEASVKQVFREARVHLAIYVAVISISIIMQSWLPLLFVGLPNLFGSWLMLVYGLTQHTGLAENVLDHRLNCRTFNTNLLNRFLYWNMNYHLEHHMFPQVPYHALPRLHEAIKEDSPKPYPSLWSCWREIIPTVKRQLKEPGYHVRRELPAPPQQAASNQAIVENAEAKPDEDGWIEVCAAADLHDGDVIRFDYQKSTYALYRDETGELRATDGICTHGNTHLADGLVIGQTIECPKHNGRFNLTDGSPARAPVCRALRTHPIEDRGGRIWIQVPALGATCAEDSELMDFEVTSNKNVSSFIKELTLKPLDADLAARIKPGDYLQLKVPVFENVSFSNFDIQSPYRELWQKHGLFDLSCANEDDSRLNNYSVANLPERDGVIRFNVRVATPPAGVDCPPGIGSSWVFQLKPGDMVQGVGPYGDFRIKPSQREMVYLGGGAGMAPLRSHISHLLEVEKTQRKITFFYGARSLQEAFYTEYFDQLAAEHDNFTFHLVLSEPLDSDQWTGLGGFVHQSAKDHYLDQCDDVKRLEFYLCGPPQMIDSTTGMLKEMGVQEERVAYDAF